jgi:hypothetical protein
MRPAALKAARERMMERRAARQNPYSPRRFQQTQTYALITYQMRGYRTQLDAISHTNISHSASALTDNGTH